MRVLISDQGAVGVGGGVDARRKPRLPIDLIAAQEHHIDAGVLGGHHILILLVGPIFVVTAIHIDLMIEQKRVVGGGGDLLARNIADAVTILFQPVDRRIFSREHHIVGRPIQAAVACRNRPVVADRVSRTVNAGTIAGVKIGAAPGIVCLPGLIVGLEKDIGGGVRIADDEGNLEDLASLGDIGDIDAGYGVGRHGPRIGDAPVAGVDESG